MNGENMAPQMMKSGGSKGVWIAIVVIAIIVAAFFVFSGKKDDTNKDAMMKEDNAMMNGDEEAMMKKDGETMMDDGAMMKSASIKYTDTGFVPAALEIKAGETVTFTNESSMDMWVASAIHPTHEILPEFDQMEGTPKGSMYSFTFTKPGVWKFHDHLNPAMKGSVTVK